MNNQTIIMAPRKGAAVASAARAGRGISKAERNKCLPYLPLLQVLGELHPTSRLVLLKHLDKKSLTILVRTIRTVFSRLADDDDCYPPKVVKMLREMLQANPEAFKTLLRTKNVKLGKSEQTALYSIGGSAIAAILSVVVPYVIGQLLGKK